MKTAATRSEYSGAEVLFLAFELGWSSWKLASTVGFGQKPRMKTIPAGDLKKLEEEIGRAKVRFGLPEEARVVSCYEAGRDGFWLHRALDAQGVVNCVVDASSIEVKRRGKRRKTDRLDAAKLAMMLVRYWEGERTVWSVIRVPSVEAEDRRQLHRELLTLRKECTRQINRIKGLLATQGLRLEPRRDFLERLEEARLWDGSPVPGGLRFRLEGEFERLEFIRGQISELEAERRRLLRESEHEAVEQARRLMQLKGIGVNTGWLLPMEFFSWREFRNRRQVGAAAGLVGTPFNSGADSREQGISKAGNTRVRSRMVELAWCWLRYQPRSQLSLWFQERYGRGGKRMRKIGIVALARKLLIALWRYLEFGILPDGAELRA